MAPIHEKRHVKFSDVLDVKPMKGNVVDSIMRSHANAHKLECIYATCTTLASIYMIRLVGILSHFYQIKQVL